MTSRNVNKKLSWDFFGRITRPPSQFADPNLNVLVRGETVQQCDSNPRPLATPAISSGRHVYRSASLKYLGNISINRRYG